MSSKVGKSVLPVLCQATDESSRSEAATAVFPFSAAEPQTIDLDYARQLRPPTSGFSQNSWHREPVKK